MVNHFDNLKQKLSPWTLSFQFEVLNCSEAFLAFKVGSEGLLFMIICIKTVITVFKESSG